MALIDMDFALGGGGTHESKTISISLAANTDVEIGVKSDDAVLISGTVASLYFISQKDSATGTWVDKASTFVTVQPNASGNMVVRTQYGGNATIWYA